MAIRQSRTEAQRSFTNIPNANIQRSTFNRSCGLKTAFDGNELIPIFVDEALPGDTINLRMSSVTRLSTPYFPIMDPIMLDFHFWSIPVRLVWTNFVKMMGEQTDPGDSTDYTVPTFDMTAKSFADNSLHDYMGLPCGVTGIDGVSSLFARAYYKVYNDWYRDENLQDSLTLPLGDAQDNPDSFVIQKRGKRKDYFTSQLPWPQKGDAVTLPLGTKAPIATDAVDGTDLSIYQTNASAWQHMGAGGTNVTISSTSALESEQMYADLSTATASTINSIREAFQQQVVYERDARGGTRYVEHILSHFGVTHPAHYILQRPEYLGGGTVPLLTNEVQASTYNISAGLNFGDLGAFGKAVDNGVGFTKSFLEHTIILGLVSARADLTYYQGVDRQFLRSTRFDFYLPALAHLGEQTTTNKEIYAQGTAADDTAFGYQERWAEYRYKPSKVTAQMRPNHASTVAPWHLAEAFASLPSLNATFIESSVPFGRALITGDAEPHFIMDAFFQFRHTRPMPTYSVPGLVDHF